MALTASFALSATGTLTKDDTVSIVTDPVTSGQNSFPDLSIDLLTGTGAAQANNWYRAYTAIGATTTVSIDLNGGTDKDPFGTALALTRVVGYVVAIVSPDGTKAVRVGPQGGATPFSGPYNATTAYRTVKYWACDFEPTAAGWAVTAGATDKFYLYNPGASSINVVVWILGS